MTLPNAPLTLVQIGLGILDLGFSGSPCMCWFPTDPHLDFINVMVAFVLATLLGFASHAPGGVGVFDAAMMVGLHQYAKEELLAALLLFRLLYYITPFATALVFLGCRELWMSARVAAARKAWPTSTKRATGLRRHPEPTILRVNTTPAISWAHRGNRRDAPNSSDHDNRIRVRRRLDRRGTR